MEYFTDDNYCFACGKANPYGLHLSFDYHADTAETRCQTTFPRHFQGWENVLHGGIISTVLDEAMVKAAHFQGYKCATVELTVRFKKKADLTKSFQITAKVTALNKRLIEAEATLTDADNVTVASAVGKFLTVN